MSQGNIVTIASAAFPNVYLRMDGSGVTTATGSGGGTVNCQFGAGQWEQFVMVPQADGSVSFASVAFPGVFLRMDGTGIKAATGSGAGKVNCQFGAGAWEKFRLEPQADGTFAIASVAFPGVYLRVDGSGVTSATGSGRGTVNCQFGASAWEHFCIQPAGALQSFSLVISSDPQYPWYDGLLPQGLSTDDQIKQNSARQITQQYDSMNALAQQRIGSASPVKGVLLNGDLTAFGHDWQMGKFLELVARLKLPYYPALGNHDYSNNVNDSFNNNCATRMAGWMYDWLKANATNLNYDFTARSYYKFPEARTDYAGSLSYSFNIGQLHVVQLQNYPTYEREWNSWNAGGARRDFFFIRSAMYWLKNDLATARNRGHVIIVNLHDYGDALNGDASNAFKEVLKTYGVSAVFAGHIHSDCGLVDTIPNGGSGIKVFRSGAASQQDYLVADIDLAQKKMTVRKRASTTQDGKYDFTGAQWECDLNATVPAPPLPIPAKEGHVTFVNDGGFVAQFELQYTYKGEQKSFGTGDTAAGNKVTYYIPPEASDIHVMGKECTGLAWEWWRKVFDLSFPASPDKGFRLYGTTLDPHWENTGD